MNDVLNSILENTTLLLLLAPLAALQFILGIAMIVSIARKPLPWDRKWPWLLMVLIGTIGPIIYFVVGSNQLEEKALRYQEEQERRNP